MNFLNFITCIIHLHSHNPIALPQCYTADIVYAKNSQQHGITIKHKSVLNADFMSGSGLHIHLKKLSS